MIDDLASCIMEMQEEVFKKQIKADAPEPEEEKPLADDEWICDNCATKNKMVPGDKYTAYCSKCKQKNEVIEYMATAMADDKYTKQEKVYMDHFNKSKGKPGADPQERLDPQAVG